MTRPETHNHARGSGYLLQKNVTWFGYTATLAIISPSETQYTTRIPTPGPWMTCTRLSLAVILPRSAPLTPKRTRTTTSTQRGDRPRQKQPTPSRISPPHNQECLIGVSLPLTAERVGVQRSDAQPWPLRACKKHSGLRRTPTRSITPGEPKQSYEYSTIRRAARTQHLQPLLTFVCSQKATATTRRSSHQSRVLSGTPGEERIVTGGKKPSRRSSVSCGRWAHSY